MVKVFDNGIHKITVAQVDKNSYSINWYELMGDRWVSFGYPEIYSKEMYQELICSLNNRK